MMPDYGLAVVSFDNRTYGGTSTINTAVLDTILALTGLQPRQVSVSSILERRKDQLAQLLPSWEGAEKSGIFADNFFMDNRLGDLVQKTEELIRASGEIRGTGPLVAINQLRGTFVLRGEKANIRIFFTLSPETDPRIQYVAMRILEP